MFKNNVDLRSINYWLGIEFEFSNIIHLMRKTAPFIGEIVKVISFTQMSVLISLFLSEVF